MPSTDHGTFHWNELITRDVEAAKAFFAETLGWRFDTMPMPNGDAYNVASQNGQPVGGIMAVHAGMPQETQPHWMTYIAVDDVDARVAKAKACGGVILNEPFDVPQVGRIAILQDPSGAVIGWITPAMPQG